VCRATRARAIPCYTYQLYIYYQVEVYFDPDVLEASACASGAVDGFVCTINDVALDGGAIFIGRRHHVLISLPP